MKKIKALDINNNIIFEKYLTDIPLSEEKVIKKSIEMFDDSDPCIIHKTYCMKKIYLEIDDFINNAGKSNTKELLWTSIPNNIREMICVDKTPHKLIIENKY